MSRFCNNNFVRSGLISDSVQSTSLSVAFNNQSTNPHSRPRGMHSRLAALDPLLPLIQSATTDQTALPSRLAHRAHDNSAVLPHAPPAPTPAIDR
eukprot:scaffold28261_cov33-Tisochrysis_lutea.AAC.4